MFEKALILSFVTIASIDKGIWSSVIDTWAAYHLFSSVEIETNLIFFLTKKDFFLFYVNDMVIFIIQKSSQDLFNLHSLIYLVLVNISVEISKMKILLRCCS